jgi:hypothetical protein
MIWWRGWGVFPPPGFTLCLIPASEVERVKREGNYGVDQGNNNGLAVAA